MAQKSNRGPGAGQQKHGQQGQQGRAERMGRGGVTGEGYAMSAGGASADSPKKQGDKLGPVKGMAAGKK